MKKIDKMLYFIFFVVLAVVLLKFVLALLLILVLFLFFRTWQMKKEPQQKAFAGGSVPNPKLDGIYQGDAGFTTSWMGKKFDAENSKGINAFKDKQGNQTEKYPFKTHVEKGLFDQHMFVLKIDYNVPENPFWIRWILDEVVQTGPNEYLGKMHVRIIPGFPFSVLYFELKK